MSTMLCKITIVISLCVLFAVINAQTTNLRSPRRRGRAKTTSNVSNYTSDAEKILQHADAEDVEEDSSEAVISLLHKINDRLTGMSVINDQQLRRMDNLEYKLTKLEVQVQEKINVLRTEMKEIERRTQQLDWQSSKTESSLDVLKADTAFLKQAWEHFRITVSQDRATANGGDSESPVSSKILMILGDLQNLLGKVSSLQADLSVVRRNVGNVTNLAREVQGTLPQLLTRQFFHASLLDLDRGRQPVCTIPATVRTETCSEFPKDCSELHAGRSGIHRVQPPDAGEPFFVYCDLETHAGGWTVIQHRYEGTLDFYKGWHDYKHGFGNIGGEFWLGLEKIHSLTNYKVNEILIQLEDFELEKVYARYDAFAVGSEIEGYPISILGAYNGTAGDSLVYHAGQKFSTFDADHGLKEERTRCSGSRSGAWWHKGCDTSNLNGRYWSGNLPEQYLYNGMYWEDFHGPGYSLKTSRILIRPRRDNIAVIKDENVE